MTSYLGNESPEEKKSVSSTIHFSSRLRCKNQIEAIYHHSREKSDVCLTLGGIEIGRNWPTTVFAPGGSQNGKILATTRGKICCGPVTSDFDATKG